MHNDIRITDGIYAMLSGGEVKERIASLADRTPEQSVNQSDLPDAQLLSDLQALIQRYRA